MAPETARYPEPRQRDSALSREGASLRAQAAKGEVMKTDARDCALYLKKVRGEDWTRFQAAVDDFMVRHKDSGQSFQRMRESLEEAYRIAAPEDKEGATFIALQSARDGRR